VDNNIYVVRVAVAVAVADSIHGSCIGIFDSHIQTGNHYSRSQFIPKLLLLLLLLFMICDVIHLSVKFWRNQSFALP